MSWQSVFLMIVAVFVGGDYCGLSLDILWSISIFVVILALFVVRDPSKRALTLILSVFFALGLFAGYSNRLALIEQDIAPLLNRQVQIIGYVQDTAPIRSERSQRIQINLEQIEHLAYPNYLVNIYLSPTATAPKAGSLVSLDAQLQEIQYFNNPSNFNLREKYYLNNTVGNIFLKNQDPLVLSEPSGESIRVKLQKFTAAYRERLLAIMPTEQAALLQALVLGGSRDIPASIWQDFTLTGLIHVLSISGLHTSLVALIIFGLCRFFLRNDKLAVCISIIFIAIYVLLAGLALPVVRAGIMSVLMLGGIIVGRKGYTPTIYAFTLLLMVALKPNVILELSFQLTFLATGALIFIAPHIGSLLSKYIDSPLLSMPLAVVCSVQILMLPLLVNSFHQLSLISLFSNLLLVPLVELVILFIVVGSIFIFTIPPIGKVLLVSSSIFLDGVIAINSHLAAVPWATINIAHLPPTTVFIYYLLLYLLFSPPKTLINIKYYRELTAGLFVCLLVIIAVIQPQRLNSTQIHFIDVGQGDAALLLSRDNRAILIDTGGISPTFDIGERVLNPYLRYLGLREIELLILSHGHFDHAAGSIALSKSFPINNILMPASSSSITEQLQNTAKHAKLINADYGSVQVDEWQIEILHVPHSANPNDSLVIRAGAHDTAALFTGDIDANIEGAILPSLRNTEILKVAHHGSAQSSSSEFLEITRPNLAIISVGKNNMYKHPASQTLERLASYDCKILRTDEHGAVVITLAQDKFFISTNKKKLL